jgi:hypothetical protein
LLNPQKKNHNIYSEALKLPLFGFWIFLSDFLLNFIIPRKSHNSAMKINDLFFLLWAECGAGCVFWGKYQVFTCRWLHKFHEYQNLAKFTGNSSKIGSFQG